ncbi:hypothetical protein [Stenotrophomonas sp.]|uniref:hypothetical protein n=1 Tax=Stenotrophomonas sp. TaxID=69392 RepID=UPI00289F584F|nr:hypothetical protein [Stenotrophomonas sp.]
MERIFNGILIAAGIIGGITFGLLINARWPEGFSPDSTLTISAAVIGALGTWAVGIGAMHYARQAHQLRLSEIDSSRLNEFVRVRAIIVNCQMTLGIYERMLKEADGRNVATAGLHTVLRAIVSLLPTTPISASGIFEDNDRTLSHPVDIACTMLRITAEQFMESYPPDVDSRDPELQEHFRHAISQTKSLHRMARDLGKRLDEYFKDKGN